ncbi:MAG: phosphotransferase [Candidatus Heimdallarchaeota archaeon]|nr:phosphotransferase [Candidatus Heimdallarchaeota archaeon]
MNKSPVIEEIAKELKCTVDEIKFRKNLSGTSTASVSEISWGKEKRVGILKQNTTKVEWLFYSKIASEYSVPAPKPIAFSKNSDMPWILIEKIPRGIHPKRWSKNHIEKAVKQLARFHAQFHNKEEEKIFDDFRKKTTIEWENTQKRLLDNIKRATQIAVNYEGKYPITKKEFDYVKKEINSKEFHERLLAGGTSLLHGDVWIYNFMQTPSCACLLDWQESFFGPPAWEFLYFYDLIPLLVDGFKIGTRVNPFTLDELIKIYHNEFKKAGGKMTLQQFRKSLKAAVSFQIAYFWARILKPYVINLHGGRYFIARTLRLLPSRKVMRAHFKNLLDISR